ncbi:MAG: class I SAM-dependent methyltransferase [Acidobacteriota bacterium]|nr:MAG: class I SAM-dependent methyltransferase [Acidobacteriota bacterium]
MKTKKEGTAEAIRPRYEELGVEGFYSSHGATYRNPHEQAIREIIGQAIERWNPDLSNVLDLACGSGEATLAIKKSVTDGRPIRISGIDPYTAAAYLERTGLQAEQISFEGIAEGALAGRSYSMIVSSFAMHLIDRSWLPALLTQLAQVSENLWILTPHKRPQIRPEWGWKLTDEIVHKRIRIRRHKVSTKYKV